MRCRGCGVGCPRLDGSQAIINLTGILFEKGQSFEDVQAEGAANIAKPQRRQAWARWCMCRRSAPTAESDAHYAVTKAQGELAVREAFPNAVILRPSLIFGPEDGFFNKFAAMARIFPALPLIGGGKTRFQPVFVGDVAQAILVALSRQDGRTYELGGPTVYTFKELMQLILRETGRKRAAGADAVRHRRVEGDVPAAAAQSASDCGSGAAAAAATMSCRPPQRVFQIWASRRPRRKR